MNVDSQSAPVNVRKRRGERILIWVGILGIAVILIYCAMDFSSAHTWKQFQLQMKAKGESLNFADFIPEPVPDNQNFAIAPIVASSYNQLLDGHGHRFIPPRTNVLDRMDMDIYPDLTRISRPTNYISSWVQGKSIDLEAQQLYFRAVATNGGLFPVPQLPGLPAQDVIIALSKYDSNIDELRMACRLPDSRFPLNYNYYEILLPHLGSLNYCDRMLQLRATAELENGEHDQALEDIKTSLRLVQSIQTEPFLTSGLIRTTMLIGTVQPIWQGLNEHKWSDNELTNLDDKLNRFDFISDYSFAIRAERALGIRNLEYVRHTRNLEFLFPESDDDSSDSPYSKAVTKLIREAFYHSIPDAIFYQNEMTWTKEMQDWCLPIADVQNQTISPDAEAIAYQMVDNSRLTPYNIYANFLISDYPGSARRFAFAQNAVNMARIACALERYRLVYNDYPQTLDALAPQFIDKIPHDVINGQPLKYHRVDDGKFILYSVGWNKTDEGGRVGMMEGKHYDNRIGDWIWNGTGVTNEMLNP